MGTRCSFLAVRSQLSCKILSIFLPSHWHVTNGSTSHPRISSTSRTVLGLSLSANSGAPASNEDEDIWSWVVASRESLASISAIILGSWSRRPRLILAEGPLRAEVFAPRARSKLQAQGHKPFRAQTKRAASTEDDRSGRWAWTTWSNSTSSADHYIRYFSTPAADTKGNWIHSRSLKCYLQNSPRHGYD